MSDKIELELYTVKDAAEEIGCGIMTVHRAMEDGRLRVYRFGPHSTLIDGGDVRRMKENVATEREARRQAKTIARLRAALDKALEAA
jgi:excisionase family DNA binding protein